MFLLLFGVFKKNSSSTVYSLSILILIISIPLILNVPSTGELLIFNNWRILHGRGSFSGDRKMSGCYINKEDFDSSCRIHKII